MKKNNFFSLNFFFAKQKNKKRIKIRYTSNFYNGLDKSFR